MPELINCSKCGGKISDDLELCEFCGQPLKPPPVSDSPQSPPAPETQTKKSAFAKTRVQNSDKPHGHSDARHSGRTAEDISAPPAEQEPDLFFSRRPNLASLISIRDFLVLLGGAIGLGVGASVSTFYAYFIPVSKSGGEPLSFRIILLYVIPILFLTVSTMGAYLGGSLFSINLNTRMNLKEFRVKCVNRIYRIFRAAIGALAGATAGVILASILSGSHPRVNEWKHPYFVLFPNIIPLIFITFIGIYFGRRNLK